MQLLTAADWYPASPQAVAIPETTHPSLYVQHDVIWCGISLWSVWVSCPGCIPSQLLAHLQPPCWQDSMRSWKVL